MASIEAKKKLIQSLIMSAKGAKTPAQMVIPYLQIQEFFGPGEDSTNLVGIFLCAFGMIDKEQGLTFESMRAALIKNLEELLAGAPAADEPADEAAS